MNRIYNLFFELIQVSVHTRKDFTNNLSVSEWFELYKLADKQSIIGVLFSGIERLPKEQLPDMDLLMEWLGQTEYIKTQNGLLNRRSAEITQHFKEAGYRSLIVKGQANASYYPHPELRTSGDVDILVEGDRKQIIDYVLSKKDVKHVQFHHVDYDIYDDVEIEVHFVPALLNNYFNNKKFQKYLSQYYDFCFRNWITLGGDNKICMLTNKPNVMVQLVHMYGHYLFSGIGLRQMTDFYYLLVHAKFSSSEKRELLNIVSELRISRFCGAVMYILKTVYNIDDQYLFSPINEKEGQRLLSEIMIGGNFGHYDNRFGSNEGNGRFKSFWHVTYQSFRLFSSYPSDCIWYMICRVCQFLWRTKNHYK